MNMNGFLVKEMVSRVRHTTCYFCIYCQCVCMAFKLYMYTLSIPATYGGERPVKFNVLWSKLQN